MSDRQTKLIEVALNLFGTWRRQHFTVVFYGLRNLGCKTPQLCVTQCECLATETPSVRTTAQAGENERKNSFLNYESPALTAELQARRAYTRTIQHPAPNVQFDGKLPQALLQISERRLVIRDLGWCSDSRLR